MNTDQPKGSDFVTWQKDIATLEAEHCRAFVARDFEQLERLWSDDLLVNSPINRVHDKKRVLELLRAGIITVPTMTMPEMITRGDHNSALIFSLSLQRMIAGAA